MTRKLQPTHRIAIVKARWHAEIVDSCADAFAENMRENLGSTVKIDSVEVPGAYEIPLTAKKLLAQGEADAVLGCAFVVDGGIYRHDFVANAVIDGMMKVQIDIGKPIISAVLTPHQFREGEVHQSFFERHFRVKGVEAAHACLSMLELIRRNWNHV